MIRILTAVVAIALILLFLFAWANWMKRRTLFFPSVHPEGFSDVRMLPVPPEDVYFESADGTLLHGWHFRAEGADPPLILWCHGNAGNIGTRAATAAELARRGVSVFVFDYRGYGRSAGSPTEESVYDDAIAAWETTVERGFAPAERIAVLGESLGGAYASHVAAERNVAGAIMQSTFPSAAAVADSVYFPPFGLLLGSSLPVVANLRRAGVPVLVIHGTADEVIPFELGREIHREVHDPKSFVAVEGAGHSDLAMYEGYFDTIVDFVRSVTR